MEEESSVTLHGVWASAYSKWSNQHWRRRESNASVKQVYEKLKPLDEGMKGGFPGGFPIVEGESMGLEDIIMCLRSSAPMRSRKKFWREIHRRAEVSARIIQGEVLDRASCRERVDSSTRESCRPPPSSQGEAPPVFGSTMRSTLPHTVLERVPVLGIFYPFSVAAHASSLTFKFWWSWRCCSCPVRRIDNDMKMQSVVST